MIGATGERGPPGEPAAAASNTDSVNGDTNDSTSDLGKQLTTVTVIKVFKF